MSLFDTKEEDTYNMLKGLTANKAEEMFHEVWDGLNIEMGKPIAGVPITLIRERLDPLLKPYGWSYERLFREKFNGSIS